MTTKLSKKTMPTTAVPPMLDGCMVKENTEAEVAADGNACTAEQLLVEERKRVRRPAAFRRSSIRSHRTGRARYAAHLLVPQGTLSFGQHPRESAARSRTPRHCSRAPSQPARLEQTGTKVLTVHADKEPLSQLFPACPLGLYLTPTRAAQAANRKKRDKAKASQMRKKAGEADAAAAALGTMSMGGGDRVGGGMSSLPAPAEEVAAVGARLLRAVRADAGERRRSLG
jgi:hypothetical protein